MLSRRIVIKLGAGCAAGLLPTWSLPADDTFCVLTAHEEVWLFFEGAALRLEAAGAPTWAEVVRRHFRDGRSAEVVAAALGVPLDAVNQAIQRTVEILSSVLSEADIDVGVAR